jgi:Cytochrome P450
MSLLTIDTGASLRPPTPVPRAEALGPISLLRALWDNPLETWTQAHFEQPIVTGNLLVGEVAVISDPAAIRRVLVEDTSNYCKDSLQRRMLSAVLRDGLLTAEGEQWRIQRRTLAPLFAKRSVMSFAPAMQHAAEALVGRWGHHADGRVLDIAAEVTQVTLDVLERTIFSDGLGANPEDVRTAMRTYFDTIGRIDPFDVLGLPDFVPRLGRCRVKPALRFFDAAVGAIISTRRARLAADSSRVPRDILTLLMEAQDPQTGMGLTETEVWANVITFEFRALRGPGSHGLAGAQGNAAAARWSADGRQKSSSIQRTRAHLQLSAGAAAKSISISSKSGKPSVGPSRPRPRRSAARAIVASTASRIRSGSCLGCAITERRMALKSGLPSGRKLSSAAGGRLRCAGSTTTRHAVNGSPWAAAIRAARCDSMSTTIAPVRS